LGETKGMSALPDILCIGSVLWDIIGRTPLSMRAGMDVPGRISRIPGGVALNIAATLARFGMRPAVLTAVGRDAEGADLMAAVERIGIGTGFVFRSDLPTDRYMAIESAEGLVAAIADAHSLEAAGDAILRPLADGALASEALPWAGPIALDGNLTEALLGQIARSPLFRAADLRIAPASPGKAVRLRPLIGVPHATLYVNLDEASLICGQAFRGADEAAAGMVRAGCAHVLVTNGAGSAADGTANGVISGAPPHVRQTRVTGAGDTFMAAHLVAERQGASREDALHRALEAAAAYVSGA
jgi:sugar/nucleoside kinase (ribokinase family)